MAIQEKFPSIRPSLNLDFANTKTLDPRVTFSRASTATYYDGKTVAKAEENLLIRSQEFDNAAWVKTGIAVTAGNEVAPDGTTTAETITATADNATITQAVTVIAAEHQYSIYLKRKAGEGVVEIQSVAGTWTAVTLTTSWQRFNVAASPTAGSRTSGVRIATLGDEIVAWGAQLEQRSSVTAYTPTTTQPITNYVPVLRTAAANVARFDHNPVTGESLGLLIEEQRTNLLKYSEDFMGAYWQKSRTSIAANTIVAPDGTLTGDKLVEDTSTGSHWFARNGETPSATTLTGSVYLKAGERTWASLQVGGGANSSMVRVNLSTGTLGTLKNVGAASGSASIQNVGNGWYRVTLTVTNLSLISQVLLAVYATVAEQTISYTGDGYSGIYIWGAQLEVGAFPTSYIPTTTSQVTRSADAASMTGANFSSWYRQGNGSFYVDFKASFSNSLQTVLSWGLGSTIANQNFFLQEGSALNLFAANSRAAIGPTFVANIQTKAAMTVASGDQALSVNGGAAGNGVISSAFAADNLSIGALTSSTRKINGHIRKIAYYPKRLSNTQLQALTS